ncbi:MAG: zinc ribbon domain-containing protein, partial [Bacteroidota bacterium]
MPDSSGACLSCGAALAAGADRCALCGTPAGETDPTDAHSTSPPTRPKAEESDTEAVSVASGECPRCGHVNPAGARYCNECGEPLAVERTPTRPPVTPEASGERPPSDVGKRAMLFVGIAIAAVFGLYGAQVLFGGGGGAELEPEPNTAATPAGAARTIPDGPTPPLNDPTRQAQADAFEAQATAEGFYEAGRFYLTDAYQAAQENPENTVRWARKAVGLFEQSVELEDTDEARLALAEALRVDPQRAQPMRPVLEVQTVLDRSPTNVSALYI